MTGTNAWRALSERHIHFTVHGCPLVLFGAAGAVVDAFASLGLTVLDEGRAARTRRVYGIVNDGDGDRGYLLVYAADADRVHVVPGDEVAFWIARGRRDDGSLGRQPVCVNSVESDISAGLSMEGILGIKSETACVGDKNLLKPAREGRNHIAGCEESGHVTFGVPVVDRNGGAGIEETIHPFPPGVKEARYVYFVDKSRFYRGSPVWAEDERIVAEILRRELPPGYTAQTVDFADDRQMLYVACIGAGRTREGALFIRNSGTEVKTVVTLRCTACLAPAMRAAAYAVHRRNQVLMKDAASSDALVEKSVLSVLAGGPLPRPAAKERVERLLGTTLSDRDFAAVLFAMKKERVLRDSGDTLAAVEE